MADNDYLIAITMFIVLGTVSCIALYLRYRSRLALQETVRVAIEQGRELTPGVLAALQRSLNPPADDLRRAIMAWAISAAVVLLAQGINVEEATGPMRGIAAFPFAIGAAYLVLWAIGRREGPN